MEYVVLEWVPRLSGREEDTMEKRRKSGNGENLWQEVVFS